MIDIVKHTKQGDAIYELYRILDDYKLGNIEIIKQCIDEGNINGDIVRVICILMDHKEVSVEWGMKYIEKYQKRLKHALYFYYLMVNTDLDLAFIENIIKNNIVKDSYSTAKTFVQKFGSSQKWADSIKKQVDDLEIR